MAKTRGTNLQCCNKITVEMPFTKSQPCLLSVRLAPHSASLCSFMAFKMLMLITVIEIQDEH